MLLVVLLELIGANGKIRKCYAAAVITYKQLYIFPKIDSLP